MIETKCSWSCFKTLVDDNLYEVYYVTEGSVGYFLITGNRDVVYFLTVTGTDKTDFETNYKTDSTSVASMSIALSKISEGKTLIFDDEALASGVYEDSIVVNCDRSHKTFNVENTHSTGALNFKVWGSPDTIQSGKRSLRKRR